MHAVVLTIDIDNSTTNIGLFDQNGALHFRSGFVTDRNPTRDQCAINLMNLFTLYKADLREVSGAVDIGLGIYYTLALPAAAVKSVQWGLSLKRGLNAVRAGRVTADARRLAALSARLKKIRSLSVSSAAQAAKNKLVQSLASLRSGTGTPAVSLPSLYDRVREKMPCSPLRRPGHFEIGCGRMVFPGAQPKSVGAVHPPGGPAPAPASCNNRTGPTTTSTGPCAP